MQQNAASSPFSAYADRPQLGLDVEFGADPASGAAFFQSDGRKNEDLKQMLDSNKDGLKLEAMKRIIGMIARGRDASNLFPAVVKNVVSKNIEVKKLVYVYLVRYAEEQQDLALLSISTFQRALKDPNQLIRASALRVLSSIRVNMIVPIVMLAIRESAADLSPYVRKTAAHAIPKLYSLDPEQKDELVTVIEKLLSDRTTLVVGSAVMAFDEVCPERVDLIHKNYRKLCNLLVDVDEWGQVIIINMLTRYARTQFEDPNADEVINAQADQQGVVGDDVPFYNDTSSAESDTSDARQSSTNKANNNNNNSNKNNASNSNNGSNSNNNKTRQTASSNTRNKRRSSTPSASNYTVDLDHRLLLRQTKPLLQSRNASVVMAVAQLYHHVAPRNEVLIIAKALIRLLRSYKEVQSVVLTCIASMSTKRKGIFEPHLKSFFVRTSDPTHIKLLKLDILTNLASASSIALILREFQTYISSSDRSFVAATIQAIGRCAASISEVTETCLSGLVHLLSNRDEHVVAESVVVIKKLLQTKAAEHFEIIIQMAKLIDFITVPAARAAIIWLIGEYNEKVPKIAPDVLRKMTKTFVDEEDIVKLQVLNLGVKLYLTNPEQTSLLCQYVFTLARYDTNYDVRDRARFLRQFIFPSSGNSTILSQSARKVFLASKPAPAPESKYRDSNNYQLGSLSHYLNMRANGYKELPAFPEVAPDSSVRNIEGFMHETSGDNSLTAGGSGDGNGGDGGASSSKKHAGKQGKGFLSESEEHSSPYSATSSSSSSSDSDSSSESSTSSDNDGADNEQQMATQQQKKALKALSKLNSSRKVTTAAGTSTNQSPAPLLDMMDTHSNNNNNTINSSGDDGGDAKAENPNGSGTSDSESSSYSSDGSSSSSDSDAESDNDGNEQENNVSSHSSGSESGKKKMKKKKQRSSAQSKENSAIATTAKTATATVTAAAAKSNLDLLLDLDDIPPIGPVMTPSLGGFLTPGTPGGLLASNVGIALQPQHITNRIELVGPSYIEFKHKELLNKLSGHGLQLGYRFTRSPHLYSSSMASIELQFVNRGSDEITTIQLGRQSTLPTGMHLNDFAPIQQLQPGQTATSILGIDFNDSTHAIDLEISSSVGVSRVTLKPPIGELVRAVHISENCFKEERTKLRGMNEHQSHMTLTAAGNNAADLISVLKQKVFECVNVAYIPTMAATPLSSSGFTEQSLNFAGQTLSSKSLVLIMVTTSSMSESDGAAQKLAVTVNCEKMVVGSMVLNELRNALQSHFKL